MTTTAPRRKIRAALHRKIPCFAPRHPIAIIYFHTDYAKPYWPHRQEHRFGKREILIECTDWLSAFGYAQRDGHSFMCRWYRSLTRLTQPMPYLNNKDKAITIRYSLALIL